MKISVLTGKRGGFGAMVPLIERLVQHNFELEVMMTDQHLDAKFGFTSSEVMARLGTICDFVTLPLNQEADSRINRAKAMSILSSQLTAYLSEHSTNFLILYGDRSETLTSAVVATHLQIPIIHLQGGDKSGSVDDWMRHAITKLSHLHYPSTEDSRNRILRLGEEPWRVSVIGDSHLDPIIEGEIATGKEFRDKYGVDLSKPTVVVLQHSETTEAHLASLQMVETLNAVNQFPELQKVLIYPCSDFGYEGVINSIEAFRGIETFHVFENIEAPYFRRLIRDSFAMIGNSSAGLIEAPSLGTPSVNVGRRQVGRIRGDSVIDCEHNSREIISAIKKVISIPKPEKFESPYAIDLTETSASRMVKHFTDVAERKDLFRKSFYE